MSNIFLNLLCFYVNIYVLNSIFAYIYMCVCVYVCVYIHTHTHTHKSHFTIKNDFTEAI